MSTLFSKLQFSSQIEQLENSFLLVALFLVKPQLVCHFVSLVLLILVPRRLSPTAPPDLRLPSWRKSPSPLLLLPLLLFQPKAFPSTHGSPWFLHSGGNPFATVRLRPTVTNDRSAPAI